MTLSLRVALAFLTATAPAFAQPPRWVAERVPDFHVYGRPIPADFDGDGRVDVPTVAMPSVTLAILRGDGFLGFAPAPGMAPAVPVLTYAAGDVDGDGDDDVVFDIVASDYLGMRVFERTAQGDFVPTRSFAGPKSFDKPAIGLFDVDHDGTSDLVAALEGVSVWQDVCHGKSGRYGHGCPGTAGLVPTLTVAGCAQPGNTLTLRIDHGLGASTALILFGAGPAQIPIGTTSCALLLNSLLPATNVTPLVGSTGAGLGNLIVTGVLPSILSPVQVSMQALIADPASPTGFSSTCGITLDIQ